MDHPRNEQQFIDLRAQVHLALRLISELELTDKELMRYNEELFDFVHACCARDYNALQRQRLRLNAGRWAIKSTDTPGGV